MAEMGQISYDGIIVTGSSVLSFINNKMKKKGILDFANLRILSLFLVNSINYFQKSCGENCEMLSPNPALS